MKKFAVVAVAALALAGCSSSSDTTSSSATPSASMSAEDGAVTVMDPWIPQPASDTSAMFGKVMNSGTEAVKLTGGSAEGVGMVQIHEFVKQGNKEIMQEVPGGLEIPAGGSVELKPGSYHVMMMDVTADWKVGDEVPVTLDLSNGETVEVTATVKAREGMDADGMESGDMDMDMESESS